MISLPPGFNLSGFVGDLTTLGVFCASVVGILTSAYIIKKLAARI